MSNMQSDIDATDIDWTRVKNDINGNPRWVCHFTDLESFTTRFHNRIHLTLAERYARAVKAANTVGGRRYHNKRFGGGVVFQAYECQLPALAKRVREMLES